MSFLTQQQEVAGRLRLDVANKADEATLVKRWLNQSGQEIWGKFNWPFALDRQVVQTVADITTGTVSVAAGGTSVTGSSTAFATDDIGKFIQFSSSNDWYKITAVGSATDLTIEAPYTQTSALSAGTYTIRKMFYSLGSSVEKVLTIRQAISPVKLVPVHFSDLDRYLPNPEGTSSPQHYVVWGYDGSNNWTFTLNPFPDSIMNLEVRFKKKYVDLVNDDDVSPIPSRWHSTVMIDGALYRGLEYVRTNMEDRRAEAKFQQFKAGVAEMMTDAQPDEADVHYVIRSTETRGSIKDLIRLPGDYDTR